MSRALAALVVNFNSGAFAEGCVRSLQHAWRREGNDPGRLRVVVVDNASPLDQSAHLERIAAMGAEVVRSSENQGYAGGINRAYERTSGDPDDAVAVLNPDLTFLPGSLAPLLSYLAEHGDCGAVAPRTTVDLAGELHISRDLLPTPLELARTTLARLHPAWCRRYGRRRLKLALPWWLSREPMDTDMITGCCLFLRRGVVDRLGSLMDERFPLYFEDTDLYRRLRRLGLRIVRHGGARVLHHWSRSAGVGPTFAGEPLRRYWISLDRYFEKHHGRAGLAFVHALRRMEEGWPEEKRHRAMHELEPLGNFGERPVEVTLPRACRYVLELGLDPTWITTVGILGEGERWSSPRESWDWFFPTGYFLRGFDRDTGRFLGAWSFGKSTPGRSTPLSIEEIEGAVGDPALAGPASS